MWPLMPPLLSSGRRGILRPKSMLGANLMLSSLLVAFSLAFLATIMRIGSSHFEAISSPVNNNGFLKHGE